MKQVFLLRDGTKRIIESAEMIKTVVVEASKIDVLHPVISKEAIERRMEICKTCDKFEPIQERCKQCGCFMRVKTALRTTSCPLNFWKAE